MEALKIHLANLGQEWSREQVILSAQLVRGLYSRDSGRQIEVGHRVNFLAWQSNSILVWQSQPQWQQRTRDGS